MLRRGLAVRRYSASIPVPTQSMGTIQSTRRADSPVFQGLLSGRVGRRSEQTGGRHLAPVGGTSGDRHVAHPLWLSLENERGALARLQPAPEIGVQCALRQQDLRVARLILLLDCEIAPGKLVQPITGFEADQRSDTLPAQDACIQLPKVALEGDESHLPALFDSHLITLCAIGFEAEE